MNDEGLADSKPLAPFVYPDFTQESVRRWGARRVANARHRAPHTGIMPIMP
jgi:hypothetical protein